MTEERIIERTDAAGNVTERTVERSFGSPEGHSAGSTIAWLFMAALVFVVAAYLFMNVTKSESRKDEAVAAAADEVGGAAKDVGDAVKKVGDKLSK